MNGFKFVYENGIDKGIVIIIFLFLLEVIFVKIGVRLVNLEFVYSILELLCFYFVVIICYKW